MQAEKDFTTRPLAIKEVLSSVLGGPDPDTLSIEFGQTGSHTTVVLKII